MDDPVPLYLEHFKNAPWSDVTTLEILDSEPVELQQKVAILS